MLVLWQRRPHVNAVSNRPQESRSSPMRLLDIQEVGKRIKRPDRDVRGLLCQIKRPKKLLPKVTIVGVRVAARVDTGIGEILPAAGGDHTQKL